jgi:hypothetical protein
MARTHQWLIVSAWLAACPIVSFARDPLTDSTDVRIRSAGGPEYVSREISVSVSPLDPNVVMVGHNKDTPGLVFWTSSDAGQTWATNLTPTFGADPTTAVSVIGQSNAPGRLLANFIQTPVVFLRHKDSTSGAWIDDVNIAQTDEVDKPHFWVDNSPYGLPLHNYPWYCGWENIFEGGPVTSIRVARSTNNGMSWQRQDLDAPTGGQGVNIQTGRTGRVYAIWVRDHELQFGFTESDETVLPTFRLVTAVGINPPTTPLAMFPSMTVDKSDPLRDHLYVVWASNQDQDIRVMMGTRDFADSAVVWDALPQQLGKVNTATGPATLPWVSWDECTGLLAVAWLDSRNPTSRATYVATAPTRDEAGNFRSATNLTWTEVKVSDGSSPSGPLPGRGFYDYIGMASADGRAFPVWSDDRTGIFRAYTSPMLLWGVSPDYS